ncbi:hypothetical protein GCM10028805_25840 [Spirosoma harenae]
MRKYTKYPTPDDYNNRKANSEFIDADEAMANFDREVQIDQSTLTVSLS